jgi:CheY-like chemotaxis protein
VFNLGRSYYSAERDMEDKVRRLEEEFGRIEKREDRKSMVVGMPVNMWLESGFDEGGILVINGDGNIRSRIANSLRTRGYKVQEASGGPDVMSVLRKSTFSLMIVPWVMFESSGDFVNFLRGGPGFMGRKTVEAIIKDGQLKDVEGKLPPGEIKVHLIYDLEEPSDGTEIMKILRETSGIYRDIDAEREARNLRQDWDRNLGK